jgi:RimK family alpha-L-glutamate ligase
MMRRVLTFVDFLNESEKSSRGNVLFISFTNKTRGVSYHDYLKNKLDADFCLWTDLVFDEDEILYNGKPLKEYGFIFIGVVSKYPDYFVSVEQYAKTHGVPTFNYGCSPERNNKMFQNRILATKNLNPVPTIISKCSEIKETDLIKDLGLPVVAKITNGSQGKGVTLHKTKSSLSEYLRKNKDTTIIFQKFIENEGDYRLFFLGGKLLYAIERKSADKKKEFRNNYSLGGTVKRVDLPKEATDLAKKAALAMKFDVAGVDLIKSPSGEWFVLEINSAPQFGTKNGKEIVVDYQMVLNQFIDLINRKMNK